MLTVHGLLVFFLVFFFFQTTPVDMHGTACHSFVDTAPFLKCREVILGQGTESQ